MVSCNTPYDLSNTICVPNKTADLNLCIFNMITEINESKALTKHISCQCKKISLMVKIVTQIKNGIRILLAVSVKIQKNIIYANKVIFGIMLHVLLKTASNQKVFLTVQWIRVMKL